MNVKLPIAWLLGLVGLAIAFQQVIPTPKEEQEVSTDTSPLLVSNHFCASTEAHQAFMKSNPAIAKRHQALEEAAYQFQKEAASKSSPPPYTVPVVFHIIHDNGPENIPDAAILESLDHLNEAFANTGYYDQGTGVDVQIQFCLAQRTPDNLPTTGINRVVSGLTNVEVTSEDIALKDLSRWDPLNYINIWVVGEICGLGFGCGIAGYAYFPSSHGGGNDGIVVEAQWLGGSEANSSVLAHEMGHYLGLYHTFEGGCGNDDCLLDGDRVCDTPPDKSQAAVPCNGTANTCSTDTDSGFATDQNDMFNNYMDYGYWTCYNAFTAGQRDRMQFFLEGTRASLLSSPGCLDPCPNPITADFSGGNISIEIGATLNFGNESTNGDNYDWTIDGTSFATTEDASFTFNSLGTFTIALTVSSNDPLCEAQTITKTVTVTCPVTSDFNGPLTAIPGEGAIFNSQANNATDLTWSVNGTDIDTGPVFDYTFNAPGLFTVCLRASNGLCEEESCRNIIVSNPVGNCDEANFVKTIGIIQRDEEGELIIPSGDGGIYVGGVDGAGAVILVKMTIAGDVLWQRRLFINEGLDHLNDLIIDSGGQLVGSGYSGVGNSSNFRAELFRYDVTNDQMLWSTALNNASRGYRVYELPGSQTLLWSFDLTGPDDPGYMHINLADGSIDPAVNLDYDLANNSDNINSGEFFNGQLYTTGRYTDGNGFPFMRPSISIFNPNTGQELSSKLLGPSLNNSARLYGRDIIIDEQDWVLTYSGDDNGTSATNSEFFLAKGPTGLNSANNAEWVVKYDILSYGNEWVEEVISVDDGYVMYGYNRSGNRQLFLVKTDKDGNVLWAKGYGDAGIETIFFIPDKQLIAVGNQLMFIGTTNSYGVTSTDTDIIIFKVDANGNINDDCTVVEDLEVEFFNVSNALIDANLFDAFGTNATSNPLQDTGEGFSEITDICGSDCDPEDCGASFAYYYAAIDDANATSVVSDGIDYFIGGSLSNLPMVAKLDIAGNPDWVIQLFPPNNDSYVSDLRIDSDGMLFGCIRTVGGNGSQGWAFRINPVNGAVLWARGYSQQGGNPIFFQMVERQAGADYTIFGQIDGNTGGNGCDAVYLEVDRNTGIPIGDAIQFHLGSCETFIDVLFDPNTNLYYITGRYNFAGSGFNRFRPSITTLDDAGNPVWSRLYVQNLNVDARLYGYDLIQDNNVLVMGASGDENGTDFATDRVFLVRANLAGTAQWGRRIILPEPGNIIEMANADDGYYLQVAATNSDTQYLIKVDKVGQLLWARSFANFATKNVAGQSMIIQNGQIIIASSFQGAAEFPLLLRLDEEGFPTEGCIAVGSPDIEIESFNPYDGFHQINVYQEPFANSTFGTEPAELELLDLSCPIDCEEEEICDNQMDDDGDGLVDCDDPDLANDCCCITPPVLELGPDTVLCAGETLLLELGLDFADYQWSDGSTGQELEVVPPATVYVMVTDSCDVVQGDTINVGLRDIPSLDLGPDTTLCDNSVLPFTAQDGFASYEWVDGSIEKNFTAFEDGTYWVIATDSCGGVQTDTVMIEIDPVTQFDLGPDTTICEGDTLEFSVPGFTDYQWAPAGFLDCDNCPTVRFFPTTDTTLQVSVSTDLGCISWDSLRVQVLPSFDLRDSFYLCQGDTLLWEGQTITTAGTYTASLAVDCGGTLIRDVFSLEAFQTFDTIGICTGDSVLIFGQFENQAGDYQQDFIAANGCDSTHLINLTVQDNFSTMESIQICEGDSILLFGQFEMNPGIYSGDFVSNNGCDSSHTVQLSLLPTVTTNEEIQLCPGDSVLIFGQIETEPGFYFGEFSTTDGCDSSHQVRLFLSDLAVDAQQGRRTCTGEAVGVAAAIVTGGTEPYSYLWSNDAITQIVTDLMAGQYSVTVTDANGCSVEATVVIENFAPGDIDVESFAASCAGEDNGALSVIDPLPGASYSIDGENFQEGPIFSGLPAGAYTLTVRDSNTCTFTLPIVVEDGSSIGISLPAEIELVLGDSITLVPQTNAGPDAIFNWTTSAGQSCRDCPSITVLPSETTQVTVEIMDSNGCTAQASTILLVDRDRLFYLPNVFSPNNDGINDRFTVFAGQSVSRVIRMSIFDRWGEQVFERTDFPPNRLDMGWDGRFRGEDMNVGVFVYYVDVELVTGEVIRASGDLALLR